MEKDNKRGNAVVEVLKSSSVSSLGKEFLELGLDSMLDSGALKDIPLVGTVLGIYGTADTIRDHLFAKKLIGFLSQLSEISQEERISMVEKLNEDEKFSGRVGSSLLEMLDRIESEKKPELAARCFAAYARGRISFEDLRRVLHALERIPSFDIDKLEKFSNASMEESQTIDESILLAFVNAGLAKNNGGFGGGAIVPTNLCKIFVMVCTDVQGQ